MANCVICVFFTPTNKSKRGDNREGKPEACTSEQSLRPPERSRLLDEPLSFQRLHKTVCIPISPQHCMLVQIGTADLGAVDFTSWTLLGVIHLRGHPNWSAFLCVCVCVLVYLNTSLQQSQASQTRSLVTFSQGHSLTQAEVSALSCALR